MKSNYKEDSKIFSALCDEKRLKILELLRDGGKCACVLTDLTGIKQTALSYHMKILCESKIVTATQDGKWVNYSLSKNGSISAINLLGKLTTPNTTQIPNSVYLENLEKCEKPSA